MGEEELNPESSLLPCIVADSAAFLRNVQMQELAERVVTIQDVLNEIRDAATRQRLAVLPYELDFREPSIESVKFVTDFSKKTGDFKSLSATDMRVLALTYQLEREYCGDANIRKEPTKKAIVVTKKKMVADNQMAGFYYEKKSGSKGKGVEAEEKPSTDDNSQMEEGESIVETHQPDDTQDSVEKPSVEYEKVVVDVDMEDQTDDGDKSHDEDGPHDGDKIDDGDKIEGDDDDDDGWITPSNIKAVKSKLGMQDDALISDTDVKCGCLTTDFAMQNVLIQMGLHVISVDGRLIRQARSYIQKCFGCHKETHDMTHVFCPSCGNKTLMRVAVTISEDGTMQYHYPKRGRNHNIRGTKYSLPQPKGGRHVDDVILCADQKMGHKNMPKQKDKVNPLDPDYVVRSSPFAMKDTNSRAFNLGLHVRHTASRNPNQSKKKSGKRK